MGIVWRELSGNCTKLKWGVEGVKDPCIYTFTNGNGVLQKIFFTLSKGCSERCGRGFEEDHMFNSSENDEKG